MAARPKPARRTAEIQILSVVMAGLAAWSAHAEADLPLQQAACAAYDIHVLTAIEDHGLLGDTDPRRIAEAAISMLDARAACGRGETERGLALYESISLDHPRMSPFHRVLLR